jgi:sugar lactone lactonase YvrE
MSTPFTSVHPFNAPRCQLAESPRWAEGHWWWVDASSGVVYWRSGTPIADLGKAIIGEKRFNTRTSLVQPVGNSQLVIAVQNTLRRFEFASGDIHECGPAIEIPLPQGWLLNDGIVDIEGNIWIGSVSPNRAQGTGSLLRITADGEILEALPRFSLTNGMAWDHDKEFLYHVDSFERTVWRHEVNVSTGSISRSEVLIQLPTDDGLPDGISLDPSGRIWLAIYGKSVVRSYDKQGNFLDDLAVPTEQVTSVAHGGLESSQLLITTAQEDFTTEQSEEFPLAGQLFISES